MILNKQYIEIVVVRYHSCILRVLSSICIFKFDEFREYFYRLHIAYTLLPTLYTSIIPIGFCC